MARRGAGAAVGVAEAMTVDDWFDIGWDAYKDGARHPELLPPQNDMEARRAWLGGFGAAWVEASGVESVDVGWQGRAAASAQESPDGMG